jgi:hypothetical protein
LSFARQAALSSEEIQALKSQASKYRRERESYKEMVESLQKNRPSSRGAGGGPSSGDKDKVAEMQYNLHVLEDELGDAKLETAKARASLTAMQSAHEIQVMD